MKKTVSLALALVLILSLCACGSQKNVIQRANEALEDTVEKLKEPYKQDEIQSYQMELNLDMKMSINTLGSDTELDIQMNSNADVFAEQKKAKMKTGITAMDQESFGEYVVTEIDGAYDIYSSEDGAYWEKERSDLLNLPIAFDLETRFAELKAVATGFEELGKKEIRGVLATVYAGIITGEDVKNAVAAAGMSNFFTEEIGTDLASIDLAELGSIPTTIAVDKESGYIVQYSMELAEVIKNMLDMGIDNEYRDETSEDYVPNLDELGYEIKVSEAMLIVDLYGFNQAEDFVIPAVK